MLSDKMQEALNAQINAELYSSYLYLAIAAHFEGTDLPGFASWMTVQAQEELFHAKKFYDYIYERDGEVTLQAIDGPPKAWDSPLAAFDAAYKHEQHITGRIHELVALARELKDPATENFLQWFVSEQVEEEATAKGIVQQLRLIGDSGTGKLIIDRELGTRVFTPPPAE